MEDFGAHSKELLVARPATILLRAVGDHPLTEARQLFGREHGI